MRKVLLIACNGTVLKMPCSNCGTDPMEQPEFNNKAITSLAMISNLDFEFTMIGEFMPLYHQMLRLLAGEGIIFNDAAIGNGALLRDFSRKYDLSTSFVIGSRLADVERARELGLKAILFCPPGQGAALLASRPELIPFAALVTENWLKVCEFLRYGTRCLTVARKTRETEISLFLDIDGTGESRIETGLGFFDHMLWQIVHHASFSMDLKVKGDLHVDEHHTIEDTGIVLGEAVRKAIGSGRAMERYGFVLPMDECDAGVVIDFGGRTDFFWDVTFSREKIGDVPTEMFRHFFRSFAESAAVNLHIRGYGENEHHKIEGVFKAFARAVKNAVRRDIFNDKLPTSKGVI